MDAIGDADDSGWWTQREMWSADGVAIISEAHHVLPNQGHVAVNESFGLGLARLGAYRRRVRGRAQIVDANTGFLRYRGDEVAVGHFTGSPGAVTYLTVDPGLCEGGFDAVAAVPSIRVTPQMTLTHLRLLRSQAAGDDLSTQSLAFELVASALEQRPDAAPSYARRSTGELRHRLVTEACELLHVGAPRSLVTIARSIGCSPFHLSRVFHAETGLTIPQYRGRLRVHEALRLLDDGHRDLAGVAAASGFADHSHMTRSIVAALGSPPSRLRELLASAADAGRATGD